MSFWHYQNAFEHSLAQDRKRKFDTMSTDSFNSTHLWCCVCRNTRPLTQARCAGSEPALPKIEEDAPTPAPLPQPGFTACYHRTCQTCKLSEDSTADTLYPISIPWHWTCHTCSIDGIIGAGAHEMVHHVLDILNHDTKENYVTIKCSCEDLTYFLQNGQQVTKVGGSRKKPAVGAVYDQFGRRMSEIDEMLELEGGKMSLAKKEDRKKAKDMLLAARAGWWLERSGRDGLMQRVFCMKPDAAPAAASSEDSEPPAKVVAVEVKAEPAAPRKIVRRIPKKASKAAEGPQLTEEEKLKKQREEDEAFAKMLARGNSQLTKAAEEVASRKSARLAALKTKS